MKNLIKVEILAIIIAINVGGSIIPWLILGLIAYTMIKLFQYVTTETNEYRINQLDEDGKRTGLWVNYYSSGTVQSIGRYNEDNRSGKWEYFTKEGDTDRVINY